MKKEPLYFAVILVVFVAGFLLGKSLNDTGRYVLDSGNNFVSVFDTKTGVYHIRYYGGEFHKKDIINASDIQYKQKK